MDDIKYMKLAFQLSKKGMGFTEPNPLVGAVVVKDNRIISTGYHARYGTAHAEQMALKDVDATDSTLYVTLEPCHHFGKTPPCAELVIEKKVKRVVAAIQDPNPKVNGKGILRLKENGIEVEVGVLEEMAKKINRHYLKYISSNVPYVALHGGVSIDGKLTDKYKKSQWITSQELRAMSHSVRGEFSAIMAGVRTVIEDNPHLTLREADWDGKRYSRIVLDSNNTLSGYSNELNIYKSRDNFPLIIFSSSETSNKKMNPNADHHFFISPDKEGGKLDLQEVLETLHSMGIASVLVEGGGTLIGSFLKKRLYDELFLFTADSFIGGKESVEIFADGVPVSDPVVLTEREIIPLRTGYLLKGYKR